MVGKKADKRVTLYPTLLLKIQTSLFGSRNNTITHQDEVTEQNDDGDSQTKKPVRFESDYP